MIYTPLYEINDRTFSRKRSNVHSQRAKTRGVHSGNYELYKDLADPSFRTKYTISVQLRNGSSARRRSMSIELANFKDN